MAPASPLRGPRARPTGPPASRRASVWRIDVSAVTAILSALGLSGATGLNPWLPLLITSVLQRSDLIALESGWDQLATTPAIAVFAVLFVLDFIGDKIPLIDHLLHLGGTVAAPVAGAVLFDAQAGADLPSIVSVALGGGSAGVIHAARAGARPAISGATGGLGAPVVSAIEDAASGLLVLVAFLLPIVAGLAVIALLIAAVVAVRHLRRLLRARVPKTS